MFALPEEIVVDILSHLDVNDRIQASVTSTAWRAAFFRTRNFQDVIVLIDSEQQCSKLSCNFLDHSQHIRLLNGTVDSNANVSRTEKQVVELLCHVLSLCSRVKSVDLTSCKLTNRIPLFGHENDTDLKRVIDPCRAAFSRVTALRLRYCFGWLLTACVNLRSLVIEDRLDMDCSLSSFALLLSRMNLKLHLAETVITESDVQTFSSLADRAVLLEELEIGTQITYLNMSFQNADSVVSQLRTLTTRHPGIKLKFAMFIDRSDELQSIANSVFEQVAADNSLSSITLSIRCDTDREIHRVNFDSIPFCSLRQLSVVTHSAEFAQCSLFRTVFRSLLPAATASLPLTHLELSLPKGTCSEWCTLLGRLTHLRVLKLSGHVGRSRRRPVTNFCLDAVAKHCRLLERLSLLHVDFANVHSENDKESLITFSKLRQLTLRSACSIDRFCLAAPALRTLAFGSFFCDSTESERSYLHFWRIVVARHARLTQVDVNAQPIHMLAAWLSALSGLPSLQTIVLRGWQTANQLSAEWDQLRDAVKACRSLRWLLFEDGREADFSPIRHDVSYLHISSPRSQLAS